VEGLLLLLLPWTGWKRKKGAKTRSWSHQIYIIEKRKEKEKR
jgi:hypothetical protein